MAGIGVWGVYYPIVIIEEPQGYYCVVIVKEPHGRTEVVIEASMFRLSSLGNAPNGCDPRRTGLRISIASSGSEGGSARCRPRHRDPDPGKEPP